MCRHIAYKLANVFINYKITSLRSIQKSSSHFSCNYSKAIESLRLVLYKCHHAMSSPAIEIHLNTILVLKLLSLPLFLLLFPYLYFIFYYFFFFYFRFYFPLIFILCWRPSFLYFYFVVYLYFLSFLYFVLLSVLCLLSVLDYILCRY